MSDKEFLSALYKNYGVLPPGKYDQDWEFTAGDSAHTEDYIDFYNENLLTMHQKLSMVHMIIQGFDDLIIEGLNADSLCRIWKRIKIILLSDRQFYNPVITYWACLDTELEEDRFYVSAYMRELI